MKSMQELATLGRTDQDSSQSGDWSSFMRKLSSRDKESRLKSHEVVPGEYNSLLWSLFEAGKPQVVPMHLLGPRAPLCWV